MVVLLAFTIGGVHLGSAVIARHRAQAAADLAALAAATHLADGKVAACGWASLIAQTMGVVVVDCAIADLDVVITVRAGKAQAGARAGPS